MGQKGLGKAWNALQLFHGRSPFALHDGGHQIATLGHVNGRLHQVGKRQLAKALAQRHPGRHRAGHGDGIDAPRGRRGGMGAVLSAEVLRRPALRGAARGIQAMQLLSVPQDGKGVAAQAVADRLGDGDGGCGRNGRIDCIAALPEHAQARLCRQRVRGGHHIAGKHRQAGGGIGIEEIELHGKRSLVQRVFNRR
jgi:hypothetical protein